MSELLKKERIIILAYDQGMEHGPSEFNLKDIDPNFMIKIAENGKIDGIVLGHGIAEKYPTKAPLIVKLNGKTKLKRGAPMSHQLCSVDRALRLGATALGFTIYPGSEYEAVQFQQFSAIVEKAHKLDIPVIAWVYPRGQDINELSTDTIAYAARIALELGADFCKIKYNGDPEGFAWAVKSAGKCKVLVVGGPKDSDESFLTYVKEAIDAGATGIAVGRNIRQHDNPAGMLEALKEIIYNNNSVEEALKKI